MKSRKLAKRGALALALGLVLVVTPNVMAAQALTIAGISGDLGSGGTTVFFSTSRYHTNGSMGMDMLDPVGCGGNTRIGVRNTASGGQFAVLEWPNSTGYQSYGVQYTQWFSVNGYHNGSCIYPSEQIFSANLYY